MSDLAVSVVASAHKAREEFEEHVRRVLREAVAKIPQSPFRLDVYFRTSDVTTLGDAARTFIYDVEVKAEIGDGF